MTPRDVKPLRAASCFSGIGGAELALPEADWLWCAEIEKFPSDVLATRFGHPNLGDITAPDFIERALAFGPLDLLAGGPPCQAFSLAGLRKGMSDPRGQLSIRFLEIAHAIRPRNLLVENVPGWLNHEDNAFGCFLGGLVGADDALLPSERPRGKRENKFWRWHKDRGELVPRWPDVGMVAGPWGRAAWRVLDAQYAGLAQRRERVFLVADFGEGADPAAILFERRSLHGDSPPRREEGEGVTGTLGARIEGSGGLETDFEGQGGVQPVIGGGPDGGRIAGTVSSKWAKGSGGPAGDECYNMVAEIAGTLPAGGNETGSHRFPGMSADTCDTMLMPICFPERMSGTQYGTAENLSPSLTALNPTAVAFSCKDYGADATDDLSPTMRAMGHAESHANAGGQVAVAIQAGALRTNPNSGPDGAGFSADLAYTLEARAEVQAVAFDTYNQTETGGITQTLCSRSDTPGSNAHLVPAIVHEWAVRRLTPTECERLMGFPDGWTLIETDKRRTIDEDEAAYLAAQGAHVVRGNDGKLRTNAAADGPRYKALGNAWAVACVRPIMLNIMAMQPDLFAGAR